MKKIAYIYTLEYPEGNIRYVGQSKDSKHRYYDHLHDAEIGRTPFKSEWINSLKKEGKLPVLKIWEEVDPSNYEVEKFYISLMKSWGFSLLNKTDGGEIGKKVSKDIIDFNVSRLNAYKAKIGCSPSKGTKRSLESNLKVREARIKQSDANIYQFTLEGELINKWEATKDAALFLGTSRFSILKCVKGEFYQAHGFIWIRCSEYDKDPSILERKIERYKSKYLRRKEKYGY